MGKGLLSSFRSYKITTCVYHNLVLLLMSMWLALEGLFQHTWILWERGGYPTGGIAISLEDVYLSIDWVWTPTPIDCRGYVILVNGLYGLLQALTQPGNLLWFYYFRISDFNNTTARCLKLESKNLCCSVPWCNK